VQGLSFQNREPDLMILLGMTHCRGVRSAGGSWAAPGGVTVGAPQARRPAAVSC
jgi:hypothetical protein